MIQSYADGRVYFKRDAAFSNIIVRKLRAYFDLGLFVAGFPGTLAYSGHGVVAWPLFYSESILSKVAYNIWDWQCPT